MLLLSTYRKRVVAKDIYTDRVAISWADAPVSIVQNREAKFRRGTVNPEDCTRFGRLEPATIKDSID